MPSSPLYELFDSEYPHELDDNQSLYDSEVMREVKSAASTATEGPSSKTYTTLQPARPQQYRAMTAAHAVSKSPLLSACTENVDLLSWKTKHPEYWTPREVLDWLYFFAEHAHVDCGKLHGEHFQSVTGPMLCAMTREDFISREPQYGARIYELFHQVLENADFIAPREPSTISGRFATDTPMDMTYSNNYYKSGKRIDQSELSLGLLDGLLADEKSTTVAIGEHMYDIDLDTQALATFLSANTLPPHCFSSSTDDGYGTGSDAESSGYEADMSCTDVFDSRHSADYIMIENMNIKTEQIDDYVQMLCAPTRTNMTHEKKVKRPPGRPKKVHSDADVHHAGPCGEKSATNNKKRTGAGSKGNHLWEFIRDTLKNPMFNPKLLKWENHSEGVFKFVQSEAVAQMWGQKKNNPAMTYEKLSRAMRFCRSAGYFTDVPKNGKYPKKLCFKFGKKAHGWE